MYRWHLLYSLDISPPPPFADYKYGGAYNSIMVITLVYTPLSSCGAHKGNSNGRIVRHRLVWLVMKVIVAQFCRAKDHEVINESAECVRSENAV